MLHEIGKRVESPSTCLTLLTYIGLETGLPVGEGLLVRHGNRVFFPIPTVLGYRRWL